MRLLYVCLTVFVFLGHAEPLQAQSFEIKDFNFLMVDSTIVSGYVWRKAVLRNNLDTCVLLQSMDLNCKDALFAYELKPEEFGQLVGFRSTFLNLYVDNKILFKSGFRAFRIDCQ